jgi:hypothetical protein
MTFVPVIDRELRVSARKRSTFWLRVVACIIALVIGTGFLVLGSLFGQGTAGLGGALFRTLTWLALAAAVSAGIFFTADALSEEKREGTLGFLFLTDLTGYDVAGGKLLATSLRGSYALLAFFPVLATTFLMGGVTGPQFWKTNLALVNMLFVSLSVGLLVSSLSWDSQKAMAATLLLLLMVCASGPLADALLSRFTPTGSAQRLSLSSPLYVFILAGAWRNSSFWSGLLVTHLGGWLALGLASFLVRRTWHDRSRRQARFLGAVPGFRSSKRRERRRRRLLEKHPVLWLASRDSWPAVIMWTLALLATAAFVVALSRANRIWQGWTQLSGLLFVILYFWAASQSSRLFLETRKRGFLELFLVTPLSIKDAARGQWHAWARTFAAPLLLLLAIDFGGRAVAQERVIGAFGGPGAVTDTAKWAILLVCVAVATISIGLNLAALLWSGMWMGLTSKTTGLAVLKTIAFVQVIPWFAISFLSGILLMLISFSQVFRGTVTAGNTSFTLLIPLFMTIVPAALAIAKDIGFILWARRRLYGCPRERAIWNLRATYVIPEPMPPSAPRSFAA